MSNPTRHALLVCVAMFTAAEGCSPSVDEGSTAAAVSVSGTPITSGLANKCLNDLHSVTTDGNELDITDCNGTAAQSWTLTNGAFVGVGGKCMSIADDDQVPGGVVHLFTCNGTEAEQWKVEGTNIVSTKGLCLDVKGESSVDHTPLQVSKCVAGVKGQVWHVTAPASPCPTIVTPTVSKSLLVQDPAVLAKFPIGTVLNQIASSGDTTGQLTGIKLYQQLMDNFNDAAHGVTKGPHCTGTLNGFDISCPRPEGGLASTDPTTGKDAYNPLALVNRFDLAPSNGANCGQYRVVYGKNFTGFDRTLIIFEAVLPNPNPAQGIAACLPVVEMWNQLSASGVTSAEAATTLSNFYFKGLSGFSPVIQAAHYGFGNTSNTGQIRVNTFNGDWQLLEFRLAQTCQGASCALLANQSIVQTNPEGSLFGGTDAQSVAFQKQFISQIPALAANDLNLIGMSTPTADSAGMSDEQSSQSDYFANGQGTASLIAAINAELVSIKRTDLTADNILNRATTQGCAGCHEVAPGRAMGGGLPAWPQSNGFTQIDEQGNLSQALTGTFLPFRAKVMVSYLDAQCGVNDGGTSTTGDTTGATTVGGGIAGSSN